jgi:ribosomal protein L40E
LNTERYWVQRLEAQLESQARKEMVCPRCNTSRPGDAQVCPECGRWYTTVEKSMQAVRVMPSARKAGWAGLVAVVFGGLIAVLALAPLLFVFLVIAAAFVAPLTVVVLEARARRRAGDRT